MTDPRRPARPLLRWLTPLLMVVVAALAGLGLVSLRQDRRAAEQDAETLAGVLADGLARESAFRVASAIQSFASQADEERNGLLRFAYGLTNSLSIPQALLVNHRDTSPRARHFIRDPARFPARESSDAPQPPAWILTAPPDLLATLETAEASARKGDVTAARTDFQAIAKSAFPPLRAVGDWQLTLLGDEQDRVAGLKGVAMRYPENTTPSGVAVADLALLQAIAFASRAQLGDLIQDIISRSEFHPSFLSEPLFSKLREQGSKEKGSLAERIAAARVIWKMEQNARPLLAAWRHQHAGAVGIFSVTTAGQRYFLLSRLSPYVETNVLRTAAAESTNHFAGADLQVVIVPDLVVSAALSRAVADIAPRWPGYLSAELEMAGQRFGMTPWAPDITGRWDARPLLVERLQLLSNAHLIGGYPFRLTVRLADPDLLYGRQRRRLFLFGLLIVTAAGAAFGGAWLLQKNLDAQLRLNEQKSNFVSSVSHELRAPIASVRLMAESLERGKIAGPEKQNEYFRFIGQECRRLSALIENVLDFSRIEQGRKQYEFEPTDLPALIQQTVKLMEPYAAEKGVRLEINAARETQNVEFTVDGSAIQQALVNLIDNAIKHSPNAAIVTVALQVFQTDSQPPSGLTLHASRFTTPHFTLSITDQGEGIPTAEHERIFERFYRLGSELRRETQGVGIGLSIVKHIVEAHGGRVRVESEPGQGSRFTIELPLKNESGEKKP